VTSNTNPVLHIDLLALKPDAEAGAIEALLAAAAGLLSISNVLTGGAIRGGDGSDFDLGVYFVLAGFTDLEPFGTDAGYARFLQTKVAPVLRSFTGASVSLQGPFPGHAGFAACLALAAPEETYDWEVREALSGWLPAETAASAVGLAIGERQRYRGCVIGFANALIVPQRIADSRFETAVIAGQSLSFE
jgi:hypothetical protein